MNAASRPDALAWFADGLHRVVAIRERIFDDAPRLFGDPAWNILLAMYASRVRRGDISVSSACHASGAPATTALRHIARLTASGLVGRRPHPDDRRSELLFLTEDGLDRVERVIEALAGLLSATCPQNIRNGASAQKRGTGSESSGKIASSDVFSDLAV